MTQRETKRHILVLTILIISISSVFGVSQVEKDDRLNISGSLPAKNAQLSIPSVSYPTEIGETFEVNITIMNVTDLRVWQAGVSFNSTVLEAISFNEGPFLKEQGETLWTPGTINNSAGIINYHASAVVGSAAGVNGSGTVGRVTFRVIDYGDSTIQLTDVLILNSNLRDIPKIIENGTIKIKIPGDINGDFTVNTLDLYALGRAFGSTPSSPNWNIEADVNRDLAVDVQDLQILNAHYGHSG
jgi:hypothetical protein